MSLVAPQTASGANSAAKRDYPGRNSIRTMGQGKSLLRSASSGVGAFRRPSAWPRSESSGSVFIHRRGITISPNGSLPVPLASIREVPTIDRDISCVASSANLAQMGVSRSSTSFPSPWGTPSTCCHAAGFATGATTTYHGKSRNPFWTPFMGAILGLRCGCRTKTVGFLLP